jgi:hypothetical protein
MADLNMLSFFNIVWDLYNVDRVTVTPRVMITLITIISVLIMHQIYWLIKS